MTIADVSLAISMSVPQVYLGANCYKKHPKIKGFIIYNAVGTPNKATKNFSEIGSNKATHCLISKLSDSESNRAILTKKSDFFDLKLNHSLVKYNPLQRILLFRYYFDTIDQVPLRN